MSSMQNVFEAEALDPIDIVETIAAHHEWDFDRVADDQIAMAVAGQWRTYSLTLAWSGNEETLRLIATFDLDPPEEKLSGLYEVLNRANDMCWAGAFTFWRAERVMVWRYGLVLSGGQIATPEQIDRMISAAVTTAERFYPAMQLVAWGDHSPEAALQVAIAEAFGRA